MNTKTRFALFACSALLATAACTDNANSDRTVTTPDTTGTTSNTTTSSDSMTYEPSSASGASGATDTATAPTTTTGSTGANTGTMTTEPGRTDTADQARSAPPTAKTKKSKKMIKSQPTETDGKSGSTTTSGAGYSGTHVGDHPDMTDAETDSAIERESSSDISTTRDDESIVSGSTESADADDESERDWSELNPEAYIYEPHSRIDARVGSTSITGVPRSHAQAGRETIFSGPNVIALRDSDAMPKKAEKTDLAAFPYDKREDFKDTMESRLDRLETRIDGLKGDIIESAAPRAEQHRSMLDSLEAKHEAAESRLEQAERVPANRWEGFKSDFNSQIVDLERSFEALRTAIR